MNLQKIASVVGSIFGSLVVIIGAVYTLDGRWVLTRVYADDMNQVQMRQLKFEGRGIQKDINDLEDRIANPQIPEKRKEVYKDRLRNLIQDKKEIEEQKIEVKKKGGK